jgi:SAM-dependent MidA family methyltransferase
MALYYPQLGYYTSGGDKIGETGDYYTAPYFTNIYGNVLSKQLDEMWHLTGEKEFTIVEFGAGPGSLCVDILKQLSNYAGPEKKINYGIIEKSEVMVEKEKKLLNAASINQNICWYNSIREIPPFTGCVIANEVLDNFSVHKVIMKGPKLMEVFVDYNGGFIETLEPASDALINYFQQLDVKLPDGFCAEVNLQAIDWLNDIAASLQKGFVLTIDYGFPSSELYQSSRSSGTIVCYNKHSVNDQPFANIGEQDITAHINFSALNFWGNQLGLLKCGYTNQSQFLLGLGLAEHLRKIEVAGKNDGAAKEKLSVLHNLLMSLGKKIKVLIQQKGMRQPLLSGLRFSQPLV